MASLGNMVASICPLDADAVDGAAFGAKAAMLNLLMHRVQGSVPDGFCVSAQADLSAHEVEGEIVAQIARLREGDAEYGPLIVRSSAIGEDYPGVGFAGRFESVRNNWDVASVTQAISAVRKSAESPRVLEYCEELGIPNVPRVACIVQRQITPENSGVVFTKSPLDPDWMMLEMVKGEASRLLRGQVAGDAFHFRRLRNGDISIRSLNARGVHTLAIPVEELHQLVTTVAQVLGSDRTWDIEWCAERLNGEDSEGKSRFRFHLVQAREVTSSTHAVGTSEESADVEPVSVVDFPDGTKAYAASLFKRLDLGAPGLVTLRRNQSDREITEELKRYLPGPLGTTVRFSNAASDIGLKREFIPRHEKDLARKYFEARGDRTDLFGIVHHYMPPDHSFEAYLDTSFLVVEHVPGIWESDSTLQPDLFIFEHGEQPVVWRYTKRRKAVVKRPGQQISVAVDPLDREVLDEWAACFQEKFNLVRRNLSREVKLPVNIHFIGSWTDREPAEMKYSFLNLRMTPRLRLKTPKQSAYHVVNSVADMDAWDGRSALLLRVTFDRGDERQALVPIAKRISRAQRAAVDTPPAVYAEFGILSHPAIVLREFGVDVQPIHTDHEVVPVGLVR